VYSTDETRITTNDRFRHFDAVAERDGRGRIVVRLPFDPSLAWGARARHHVTGTVAGRGVRGPLTGQGTDSRLVLGQAWCRDNGLAPGQHVEVVVGPEGPQVDALAPDIAAALAARPEARAFFDSLATFYRTGYLRWVDATRRRPEARSARIAEMVELLAAGRKQRPR
jgi:hypothetical protein